MDIYKKEDLGETQVEHDDVNTKAHIQQLHDAQAANAEEHNTTVKQALREHWKAVLWSAVISLTIVMEGYDQRYTYRSQISVKKQALTVYYSLMSNFFGYPTFQRKFGKYVRNSDPKAHISRSTTYMF